MPLARRTLSVVFQFPQGDITLDESLDLSVQIKKTVRNAQTTALITCYGLTQSVRQKLQSQINAYTNRNAQTAGVSNLSTFVPVTISAGYTRQANGAPGPIHIFNGQAFMTSLVGQMPNLGVQITAATQQISKLAQVVAEVPTQTTYKSACQWVADQLGLVLKCDTPYDNAVITNPFAAATRQSSLIKCLIASAPNFVDIWIDNDTLFVRAMAQWNSYTGAPILVTEFFGTPPGYTEWGCGFTTLFDERITMNCAVNVQSTVDQGSGNDLGSGINGGYIVYGLEYDLASRADQYYLHIDAVKPLNGPLPAPVPGSAVAGPKPYFNIQVTDIVPAR